jgi:hypothetical protein
MGIHLSVLQYISIILAIAHLSAYLRPTHVGGLLSKRLSAHVESVLANETRLFLLAVDDTKSALALPLCD